MIGVVRHEMEADRLHMVDHQLRRRGIRNETVLDAMKTVPREAFVPEDVENLAYDDSPLPIGQEQTISQPYIVAMMAELAEIAPEDKVLEIGTGSGYGAAVLSRAASEVCTVERHENLAFRAKKILNDLNYTNVHVRHGDGTAGLAGEAPFDAIICTAGGPDVPETLKYQLRQGGRLVIPVGATLQRQSLIQIRRTGEDDFEWSDKGPVAFVPLIGDYGWADERAEAKSGIAPARQRSVQIPAEEEEDEDVRKLREYAIPLPNLNSGEFGKTFHHLGNARVVLLGESTHGTSEFYQARAEITRYLIENHDFNIVALEADWPDTAILDGYVRGLSKPDIGQQPFSRFPEWMWRNTEFQSFLNDLKRYNDTQDKQNKAAIYGLDIYGLHASVNAVIDYLEKTDPDLASKARERYACFNPWLDDPVEYGHHAMRCGLDGCQEEVMQMLRDLLDMRSEELRQNHSAYFDVTRNADAIAAAEGYYKEMFYSSARSWNMRDGHMFTTLRNILDHHGDNAKAVVWAHNSHIGNARATEMGNINDETNLGELCRDFYGDEARLIGFGTAQGSVTAAGHWGGQPGFKKVRAPLPSSHEELWHKTGYNSAHIDLRGLEERDVDFHRQLERPRLQRAIGVIYRPETERISHYFNASPADQFDDFIWFDRTNALTPQSAEAGTADDAETYPFGL